MKINALSALLPRKETITCRHCGSTDVRPSHKASSSSEYVVYRCRNCKQHFKVVSARPRIPAILGISLFTIILGGVAVSFYMSADTEIEYQPRLNLNDSATLAQAQTAAKQGDPQAQFDLGLTYWHNDNYKEAIPLIRAAAEHGHAEAQYIIGMAYLEGRGILQNYQEAMAHFRKAAERGHLEAAYRLGIFHRDGLATPRDREAAYEWLNIAAAQGHLEALAARERLTAAMSREEIIRAQDASSKLHQQLSSNGPAQSPPVQAAATR